MKPETKILVQFMDKLPNIQGFSTTGWKVHSVEGDIVDIRCYLFSSQAYLPDMPSPEIEGGEVLSADCYEDEDTWSRCIWKVKMNG